MDITTEISVCPICGQRYLMDSDEEGKIRKCVTCKEKFKIQFKERDDSDV